MMKRWIILAMCLCWGAALTARAQQATSAQIDALLVLASNEPAALDQRLMRVEHKLRKVFQFQHYHVLGDASASILLPGETEISLPEGHRLAVQGSRDGRRIKARVTWSRGGKTLIATGVTISSQTPVVLGGVPHDGGTLIVVLSTR